MVPVQVSDKDLGDLAWLDTALLDLYLGSLPTIEYPDLSIVWRQHLVRRGSREG